MSSRADKEKAVNVQVLLRCRYGLRLRRRWPPPSRGSLPPQIRGPNRLPSRRPFSDEELRSNAPQVVTCNDYQREVAVTQTIAAKQIDRVFTFDKVRMVAFAFVFSSACCGY
jgi:kinesin family protein 11